MVCPLHRLLPPPGRVGEDKILIGFQNANVCQDKHLYKLISKSRSITHFCYSPPSSLPFHSARGSESGGTVGLWVEMMMVCVEMLGMDKPKGRA